MALINNAAVKAMVKAEGKRTGKDFLSTLESLVLEKVKRAIAEHNGGAKTLDATLCLYVFGSHKS